VERESLELIGIVQNENSAYTGFVALSLVTRIIHQNVPSVEENFDKK
jgi:hypothetical protein